MTTIKELTAKVEKLENELLQKKQELYAAQIAALPWKIGDVVMHTGGYPFERGEPLKITAIHNAARGWARVVRKRADGSWGMREYTAYRDFTLAK